MNQQEFDLRSIELNDWKVMQLSEIRKEHDLDLHNHNKVLNYIALKSAEKGGEAETLSHIKELIADGYFAREQSRRDRTQKIKHQFAEYKKKLQHEYSEWCASRKSNREANREIWNHTRHQASGQTTESDSKLTQTDPK